MFGNFDLAVLGRGFEAVGKSNLIRSDLRAANSKLSFNMEGRIQSQRLAFSYYQRLAKWFSIGFTWFFMRVNARQKFILKETNLSLGPGDELEIDDTRRSMFSNLGLRESHSAQLGFSDIDSFLRANIK